MSMVTNSPVTIVTINGLETHNEKSQRDRQVRWVPSRIDPSRRIPIRSAASKRTRHHRGLACLMVTAQTTRSQRELWASGCAVKMIRVAPRMLIDASESAPSALAAVRDGIADALGVDDRDMEMGGVIRWLKCGQEKGPYGVRIEIETAAREQPPTPDHLRTSFTRSGKIRGVFG